MRVAVKVMFWFKVEKFVVLVRRRRKKMEVKETSLKYKGEFYGFRKAFIKSPELSAMARFTLILLVCYLGKNKHCWPSVGELSKCLRVNKDTTRKYLKELEKRSHLIIKSRGIGRSHLYTPSYYRISSGPGQIICQETKPAEETIHRPAEIALNRSISSGNKDKGLKTGKELFDQKRKELGLS